MFSSVLQLPRTNYKSSARVLGSTKLQIGRYSEQRSQIGCLGQSNWVLSTFAFLMMEVSWAADKTKLSSNTNPETTCGGLFVSSCLNNIENISEKLIPIQMFQFIEKASDLSTWQHGFWRTCSIIVSKRREYGPSWNGCVSENGHQECNSLATQFG